MKNYLGISCVLVMILISTLHINAQTEKIKSTDNSKLISVIELSIIKNNESALTDKEHTYVLKAVNTSNKTIVIQIKAENIKCNEKSNTFFEQKIYLLESSKESSNTSENITIAPNSTIEFNVKLINPSDANLNTWNCTEVKATDTNNNLLSNSIVIESFIPNPKDFR